MMLLLSYLKMVTCPACGSYIKLFACFWFSCFLVLLMRETECNCCLQGIDLSGCGSLLLLWHWSKKKKVLCFQHAHGKTQLIYNLFICVSAVVFCLLCRPSATEPHNFLLTFTGRKLSACHRKVTELFLHAAGAWRSNACYSSKLLPGILLDCYFPKERS